MFIMEKWDKVYPRFFKHNIGSPSAPVTQEIFKYCISPFLELSQINAIGMHTLFQSEHLPELSDAEETVNRFVLSLLQIEDSDKWCGHICSGGTVANLQAIWLARSEAEDKKLPLRVFASEAAHYSLHKALRICAVPNASLVPLSEINQFQDWNEIEALIWLTYGDTHYGHFESPPNCVNELQKNKVHFRFHIDAAYGGLLSSMPKLPAFPFHVADSISIDFHKTGRLPLTRSVHLVKRNWQEPYPFYDADYIPYGVDYTIQGSRPFSDVMELAAYVKRYGVEGHRNWVMQVYNFTQQVEQLFTRKLTVNFQKSANILFINLPDNSEIRRWCEQFNVTGRTSTDGQLIARVFCWPEIDLTVYEKFYEGINEHCNRHNNGSVA